MPRLPELELRRRATERTRAKYEGQSFDWRRHRHCIALARYQAVQMGHKPPKVNHIRGVLSAKKELKRRGVDSVTEALDQEFERIAPAAMRLGDLAAFPGRDGLDGVMVNVGPGRMLGWREDAFGLIVLAVRLDEVKAAWRL